jgi:hypothetical protein
MSKILTVLLSATLYTLAAIPVVAFAHEEGVENHEHHEDHEHHETPKAIACQCKDHHGKDHDDHEEHEHGSRHQQAFEEGSPNIYSASTLPQDHLYLVYSHNFFWSTLPRSSNPAFWAKYTPLEHLQVDVLTTLRSPFELEGGVSYQVFDERKGDILSLTPRISFNTRGNMVGGELTASRFILEDLWQVGADVRVLSNASEDSFNRPVAAMGLNTMVRVWKDWHVFGDLVVPFDGEILSKRSLLWSAGVKKKIPDTPHVLTFYAGNTQEQSLSGRTISPEGTQADIFRLGFIFSIDIPSLTELPGRLF